MNGFNSKPCTLGPNVPGVTPNQASVIELADRGLTDTEIAQQLGKPLGVVRAQLTRARGKVVPGEYAPPPLPVETPARRPRVCLAGFDVFRPDAVAHGHSLKALCQRFGFGCQARSRIAVNDAGGASTGSWTGRSLQPESLSRTTGRCPSTTSGRVFQLAAVCCVRPYWLARCIGKTHLERRALIRFARTTKVGDVGHHDIGSPYGLDVGAINPVRLLLRRGEWRHRGGRLFVSFVCSAAAPRGPGRAAWECRDKGAG